ncbi:CIA30 family protein [Gemmatimonadota bacterium]
MRLSVPASLAALIPLAVFAQEQEMKTVVDFSDPHPVQWTIVNDGVMGGLSSSNLELTETGTGLFSGFVSLDNNGGFASTRAAFQTMDLSPYKGVTLKVRGDGRRYQLRFRLDGSFDGVAYMAEFDTAVGEWLEIDLPFEEFQATFRGRVPPSAGPLDPARIRQMGFLIGDKKEGVFKLEIAWVRTLIHGAHRPRATAGGPPERAPA